MIVALGRLNERRMQFMFQVVVQGVSPDETHQSLEKKCSYLGKF